MKRNPTEATEFPLLPQPAAGMPPARPHPAPRKQQHAQARAVAANPCESVTSAAIQAVIDKIIESRNKAESDAAAHGAEGGPGYPLAATANLDYLTLARDTMLNLHSWLQVAEVIDPPPFVTNASGSYNVHSYVRETVIYLHYARHWCGISAAYHASADARDSFELTTQALELIEPLGAEAGRCYMESYGPFH